MDGPKITIPKKNKFENFLNSKQPSMKKLKPQLAQELHLITMNIYSNQIAFKADPSLNIKQQLIINSNTKEIYYQKKIIDDIIDSLQFCYLIGAIELKKNLYIVLVKNCIPYKLMEKSIYQVQQVFVWNVHKREQDKLLSNLLTDYYIYDFWFSYDIDLTFKENIANCLEDKYDYKSGPKKNLMFYSNFSLQSLFIKENKSEWLIPLVCGFYYQQSIFDIRNGCEANCWILYRKSINSVFDSFGYQNDNKKYPQLFFCEVIFDTLDIYTGAKGSVFKQQFILSQNPQSLTNNSVINEQQCKNFLEFMKRSQKASLFFFNNRKIWDFINYQNINSHDYFFVENYQNFSIKVPKLIQKSILNRNEQVFCLVYDKIFEEMQIFFNGYFEHIPETPRIQTFKRKRNSLFNNFIFNNIQLCQESEVVQKTLDIIKQTSSQFYKKIESIKNVKQYFKSEQRVDINLKIDKDIKFYNQKIRELVELNKEQILNPKKASIMFITHNCSGVPKKSISDFINYNNLASKSQTDFVIIGLQEIVEMKGKNLSNILLNDNQMQSEYWRNLLQEEFDNYILVGEVSMLGLMTLIFQNKNSLEKYNCKILKSKLIKQGFMQMANKGGIILLIQINWYVISVLNLHLPSGTKKQDFKRRIENLSYFENYLNKKQYVHLKIIMGDFNFRNQLPAQTMIDYINQYQKAKEESKIEIFEKMIQGDEYLNYKQQKKQVNLPYDEETINFLPSYKFTPNTYNYYTKEGKRSPSWTDRIFYDASNIPFFGETVYGADRDTIFSDHRQSKKTCLFKSGNKRR